MALEQGIRPDMDIKDVGEGKAFTLYDHVPGWNFDVNVVPKSIQTALGFEQFTPEACHLVARTDDPIKFTLSLVYKLPKHYEILKHRDGLTLPFQGRDVAYKPIGREWSKHYRYLGMPSPEVLSLDPQKSELTPESAWSIPFGITRTPPEKSDQTLFADMVERDDKSRLVFQINFANAQALNWEFNPSEVKPPEDHLPFYKAP